jgi:hypothetical protein
MLCIHHKNINLAVRKTTEEKKIDTELETSAQEGQKQEVQHEVRGDTRSSKIPGRVRAES